MTMDTLEILYEEYSKSVAKGQECHYEKHQLTLKAQVPGEGRKMEARLTTEERFRETEKLESLYERERQKQHRLLEQIAQLKQLH